MDNTLETLGFTQWRRQATQYFGPLNISTPNPDDFSVSIKTASLGEVHLFEMTTSPHSVHGGKSASGEHLAGYCKLSLQLEGESQLNQDGRSCNLRPGDLALYLTNRPYTLSYQVEQKSLIVLFPQNYIRSGANYLEPITATPICKSQGLGKVAVAFFEQLAANLQELQGPHALALVKSALEMLVTVIAAESSKNGREPEDMLFHQALVFIDDHLDDPQLSPSRIAAALYISVRKLHNRFALHQVTVASYIRRRRLARIRDDLANPLYRDEPIRSISARYALFDASHLSKIFKAEYGESPTAYRNRLLIEESLS